jgi:hypothetical protein
LCDYCGDDGHTYDDNLKMLQISLPSIETEVRFLLTVSSCRHHFLLTSESVFLINGPDCGVCFAELAGLLGIGFLSSMSNRDSIDQEVSGGSITSTRNISSSSNGGGFRTCGLTIAMGDCFGLFEFRLDTFRPHDLGVGDPEKICKRRLFYFLWKKLGSSSLYIFIIIRTSVANFAAVSRYRSAFVWC